MWRAVLTSDGSYTLAHPGHGQTCHSRAGAWQEARERYAVACRLRERALEMARRADVGEPPKFRLLDVGTGLGLNLAAALEALSGTGIRLEAVSLERDTDVIRATLALFDAVRERAPRNASDSGDPSDSGDEGLGLERWHAPVRGALRAALRDASTNDASNAEDGAPISPCGAASVSCAASHVSMGDGTLRLLLGDARATLPRCTGLVFEAVFLDPFSPAVEPELWELEFLAEIACRMSNGAWLSTYTTSLAVRAKLAALGLNVGPGARVGTKAAGTVARRGTRVGEFDATGVASVGEFDPRTARRIVRRAAEWRATAPTEIRAGHRFLRER
jgi:tRNA U34 5-methylaminomethyl-2-thiouridine-forming methyltransferase MnmC